MLLVGIENGITTLEPTSSFWKFKPTPIIRPSWKSREMELITTPSDVRVLILSHVCLVCLLPYCVSGLQGDTAEWANGGASEDSAERPSFCIRMVGSILRGSPGLSLQFILLPSTQDGWDRIPNSHISPALGTLKDASSTPLTVAHIQLLGCDFFLWLCRVP